MPKRNDTFMRDSDLDQRPFGDSHFGDAGVHRHRVGRSRPFAHDTKENACSKSIDPPPSPTSAVYSWHEGFSEDLGVDSPRIEQPVARRRSTRPERSAGDG